jgi:hypothetical protein
MCCILQQLTDNICPKSQLKVFAETEHPVSGQTGWDICDKAVDGRDASAGGKRIEA